MRHVVPDIEADQLPAVRRHPAVPVALCLAGGIALDAWLTIPFLVWMLMAGVLLAGSVCLTRRARHAAAAALLLAAVLLIGGGRHRLAETTADDDVSRLASAAPRLVRLTGQVAARPEIRSNRDDRSRPPWAQLDDTVLLIDVASLAASSGEKSAVSGRVRATVRGHVLHAGWGDEVEIVGWLQAPRPPQNPGEPDFRDYLRAQGIGALVSSDHPDAMRKLDAPAGAWLLRGCDALHAEAESLFVRRLSPENQPMAAALLLGSRSGMTHELRTEFAESGLAHVLAISGAHVGILAVFLWFCCRLLSLSAIATAAAVVLIVTSYAFLTGGQPPVVRATILVCLVSLGAVIARRSAAANTLAVGAIAVLMWNPRELFQVGPQLSFLAVIGMIWSSTWPGMRFSGRVEEDPLAAPWRKRLAPFARILWRGYAMSLAIALLTAPLIAYRFNLVSPVGMLINVVLLPLVTLMMWLGYALLLVGLLLPPAAFLPAWGFDLCLTALRWLVHAAADVRLGHVYAPAPPGWWLCGFYLLLTAAIWQAAVRRRHRAGWCGLLAWTALGLAAACLPTQSEGLRCTFLSVGHGGAVLLELPGGRTLLYDAGSISGGRIAENAISQCLWSRGRTGIDLLVVSHADIDHFNAVPGLLQNLPIGAICLSPTCLDFEQQTVADLCDAASVRGVPIRLIGRDDRLAVDDEVTIRVLHPTSSGVGGSDNANSLVLLIEYAGRRILLPADLEEEGLQVLLSGRAVDVDVLLSPHHGSRLANPPELAAWSRPETVIVSAREAGREHLERVFGERGRVLITGESGAVTVSVRPGGEMTVGEFRDARR